MSTLNLLGYLGSFVLGCVVVYIFKPFLGSYSAKKGENLATKEDIAQITKVQEEIKAAISDDVWDRQEQWKLRRDALSDVVRDLSQLNFALCGLIAANFLYAPQTDEKSDERRRLGEHFDSCLAKFESSKCLAEVIVGKTLASALSEGKQAIRDTYEAVLAYNIPRIKESRERCNTKIDAVYESVRMELKKSRALIELGRN